MMLIIKDTQEMESACEFGEALRDYCFINDRHANIFDGKQYGCYQTFELRKEFNPVTSTNVYRKLRKISGLDNTDCTSNFYVYTNGKIYIGWWWDGDGTLVIQEGNKIAINTDCKCDYTWEWY